MATATINECEIYYELEGNEGELLVILNGIMMSSDSWKEIKKEYISSGYRVLTMDFRDQGKSASAKEPYSIHQHAEDLRGLLDHLSIEKVHLMGISYGGQVAMIFTLSNQDRVHRLLLFNTSARLTKYIRGIGEAWDEAARIGDGERFFKLAMPLIYSDEFYDTHWDWLKDRERKFKEVLTEEWFERYLRLSASHGEYDILEDLKGITVPTLIVGADKDVVTPYKETELIHRKIKGSLFTMIPNCGHASCYEQTAAFNVQVLGFLSKSQFRWRDQQ